MQTAQPEAASGEAERERQISMTIKFSSYGSGRAARATVERVKRMLEVELGQEITVSGRRYG